MGTFVREAEEVRGSFGYHPNPRDLAGLVQIVRFPRLLVVGGSVPDLCDLADSVRSTSVDTDLPRGLYWFAGFDQPLAVAVNIGAETVAGVAVPLVELQESDSLGIAWDRAEDLWESAVVVPAPRFGVGDGVVTRSDGRDTRITSRKFGHGHWRYEVRLDHRNITLVEPDLDHVPDGGSPGDWIHLEPATVERFGATLTRAKLHSSLTDTVFSFRATRTVFRPYQFKPVLRLLQTGATRILIADEVGLGKTIEAGLIWTELEARHTADRVLVVAPSSLVGKWQREMQERFGFELTELDSAGLRRFLEQHTQDRLPRRFGYVTSLERLRSWNGLDVLEESPPQLDLVIVDEAHQMRNPGTRSHALGAQLGDWADARVFLTATPVNLGHDDLSSMLELLAPEDFDDPHVLALRLEPNDVLHRIERTLLDRTATGAQRLSILEEMRTMRFGRPLLGRPDATALRGILTNDVLSPKQVVAARRHLAELNALSSVITRTRKAEIDDGKAVRHPRTRSVVWTNAESAFYEQFVEWCRRRADDIGMPVHFCMQMPLRLASACLPMARAAVLSADTRVPRDEDHPGDDEIPESTLPPHAELIAAAAALGDTVDSKFDLLHTAVDELLALNKQILLFTFSRPTLAYLHRRLAGCARVAVLHGGVPHDERNRIMAAFRAGDYDMVLANRVASEGLDFEFCSAVVNYDLPWNPMEIEQRIGRIDRIGQREEKIHVVNFYNEESIDERILKRVLDRIGVFERALGALEPIVQAQLVDLEKAAFDFTLSRAEREAKTDQIATAIEMQRTEAERLAGAAPDLLVSGDVDISGLERDLVRGGRYVGQRELAHLVHDWAVASGSPGARTIGADRIRLRGNGVLAEQVNQVVQRGRRSHHEVRDLVHALREEDEIELLLDQEQARIGGGTLLTATHPLVLAAVHVPEHRQARFAAVRVVDSESTAREGRFAVVVVQAEGTGERASREIWGAAVDMGGREAPPEVVDVLLAGLAQGRLLPAEQAFDTDALEGPVELATDLLEQRHGAERERRVRESAAFADARRVSLQEQLDRKLGVIERRMETALQRGRGGRQLFEGQRRRARERHEEALRALERTGASDLRLTALAVCYLEIVR